MDLVFDWCDVQVSTINTAQLTKAVPPSNSGAILAVDMSIGSGVRILSPAIGERPPHLEHLATTLKCTGEVFSSSK